MKNRNLDLWDKYSKCDKQTVVVVAVLILSAKLCMADGHFSQVEEDEIYGRSWLIKSNWWG